MTLSYLLLVAVLDSGPLTYEPFTTWPSLQSCLAAGESSQVFLRELGAGGTFKCRATWEPADD